MVKQTILAIKPKLRPQPQEPVESAIKVEEPAPDQQAIFQAIGIIRGDVCVEGDKASIKIRGNSYPLLYAGGNRRKGYDSLIKAIEATGITQRRLTVYPRLTHFPGDQRHQLGFQVVAFDKQDAPTEVFSGELEDFEFKISGLWQFIPVCRIPCISVFKNFSKNRLEYIKSAPLDKKVNFMKASHIPVMWRDAPVPPFRFNPKLDKEAQGKASFVQIKARFNGDHDTFEFISLLGMPTEEPPNYLKARKEDRAEAIKIKRAAKNQERSPVPVAKNAPPKHPAVPSKPQPVRRK